MVVDWRNTDCRIVRVPPLLNIYQQMVVTAVAAKDLIGEILIADDLFAGPVTNNIGFGTMAYLTYNARDHITIVEAGGLQCSVSLVAQVQDKVFESDAS